MKEPRRPTGTAQISPISNTHTTSPILANWQNLACEIKPSCAYSRRIHVDQCMSSLKERKPPNLTVAPPGDTETKLNAPAQLQIYPMMSTTVSKFKRLKVDIISTNFTIQKRHGQSSNFFAPPSSAPAMKFLLAMLIATISLYHFYVSLSFWDSVYCFAAMLGAPNLLGKAPQAKKTRRLLHAKCISKIDLGVI